VGSGVQVVNVLGPREEGGPIRSAYTNWLGNNVE